MGLAQPKELAEGGRPKERARTGAQPGVVRLEAERLVQLGGSVAWRRPSAHQRPPREGEGRPGEEEAAWREVRPRGLFGEADELLWAWAAGSARRRGEFARVGLIPAEGGPLLRPVWLLWPVGQLRLSGRRSCRFGPGKFLLPVNFLYTRILANN